MSVLSAPTWQDTPAGYTQYDDYDGQAPVKCGACLSVTDYWVTPSCCGQEHCPDCGVVMDPDSDCEVIASRWCPVCEIALSSDIDETEHGTACDSCGKCGASSCWCCGKCLGCSRPCGCDLMFCQSTRATMHSLDNVEAEVGGYWMCLVHARYQDTEWEPATKGGKNVT